MGLKCGTDPNEGQVLIYYRGCEVLTDRKYCWFAEPKQTGVTWCEPKSEFDSAICHVAQSLPLIARVTA